MARSHAGRRPAGGASTSRSLILPFALTLTTAAIASAGLYFFSDSKNGNRNPTPYLPSESEDEHHRRPGPGSRRRKPPRTKSLRDQERDVEMSGFSDIPEEDTDAISEARRWEDEVRRRKRREGRAAGGAGGVAGMYSYVKGAAKDVLETVGEQDSWYEEDRFDLQEGKEERERREREQWERQVQLQQQQQQQQQYQQQQYQNSYQHQQHQSSSSSSQQQFTTMNSASTRNIVEEAASVPLPVGSTPPPLATTSAAVASVSAGTINAPISAVTIQSTTFQQAVQQQHVPRARPIRHLAIVLSERKATFGHEDSDSDFSEVLPTRSLLSYLPRPLALPNSTLHVLIHSPNLTSHPLSKPAAPARKVSISTPLTLLAPEPEISMAPSPSLGPIRSFHADAEKSTYDLAAELFSSLNLPQEQIMPFQDRASIPNLVKQLEPVPVVYFEEGLLTRELAEELLVKGRFAGTVVLVIGLGEGDELGGLLSDDEMEEGMKERRKGRGMWWEEGGEVRERLGKRLQVVEAWVLDGDWGRRMEDLESGI